MIKISPTRRCLLLPLLMLLSTTAFSKSKTINLADNIRIENIRAHQQALQEIGDRFGNRLAGTSGYDASVQYVKGKLEHAGYVVTLQDFSIRESADITPPELTKNTPTEEVFVHEEDFLSLVARGRSEISGEIQAVDLLIPASHTNSSSSGCDKEDFIDFVPGNIALIQRGTCTFLTKIENAIAAGAQGIIIFNEGNEGRTGVISSRIPASRDIPILGARFAVGDSLRNGIMHGATGVGVHMKVDVEEIQKVVQNLIAETEGDKNRVMVVGAHLDSVRAGPGINDNGSGSATILEVALLYKSLKITPKNKLRFIWFGAEEGGLLGSKFYVKSLSRAENHGIQAMLNFDMLGSSNYVRFVYDGNNSSKAAPMSQSGPAGSGFLEEIFLNYFSSKNMPTHPTAFDGRSDYGPFVQAGIPAGGLFSGAEGIKSKALAAIYGGTAKAPFDPCYHRSCDDFAHTGGDPNFSLALKSLEELAQGAAHAVSFVADTSTSIREPEVIHPRIEFEYMGNFLQK